MKELYERAARAAYENSKSLLYEARLLAESSKFSRAYALCVLSTEEFCKAFLYKSVSAGLIGNRKVSKIVLIHSEKIERFIHIIVAPFVISQHWQEFYGAIQHDKNEPDHANHIFPKAVDEIGKDVPHLVEILMAIFKHAHKRKLDSLYVEVRGKELIIPKEKVGEKDYRRIEVFLRNSIFGFEIFLGPDKNLEFRKTVETLDPGLENIFAPITKSH